MLEIVAQPHDLFIREVHVAVPRHVDERIVPQAIVHQRDARLGARHRQRRARGDRREQIRDARGIRVPVAAAVVLQARDGHARVRAAETAGGERCREQQRGGVPEERSACGHESQGSSARRVERADQSSSCASRYATFRAIPCSATSAARDVARADARPRAAPAPDRARRSHPARPPRARDHDHHLAARRRSVIVRRQLAERSPPHLFELLRELARDRSQPLAAPGLRDRSRSVCATRGAASYSTAVCESDAISASALVALGALPLEKAEEGESLRRDPARDERRQERGRAGNRHHANARLDRRRHEPRAGIGEQRRSRIRDERHRLARHHSRNERIRGARLVVLVIRQQRRLRCRSAAAAGASAACPPRARRSPA